MLNIAVAAIVAFALTLPGYQIGNVYNAYTDTKHLMISDNGTPGDLDDDFICDWVYLE